ncbi:MAG: hemerythrin domain-containing protein [Kofleriaceae bacterium]|nr:MAG: hemerythrin domain-containing protein [Kofleriaceae bacterium]MBZ0236057.1 hemerythrin domain-containing protein [Kofleriaceae bacterium]
MPRITELLVADHARLGELLAGAVDEHGAIDEARYATFRAGLLRHIAIEEKLLFPVLPRPRTARLREDHARIGVLLSVSPTAARCAELTAILETHDALEEGEGGIYAACEEVLGALPSCALTERALALPAVRVAAYRDRDPRWAR